MTRIIDANLGIVEPDAPDVFAPYMPRGGQGQRLFPEPTHLEGFSLGAGSRSATKTTETTAADCVAFMDDARIERSVVYTTLGVSVGRVLDEHWAVAACRAWNSWVFDNFLCVSPRIKSMALIPIQDPTAASQELRRAVTELGMLGAMLPATGEGLKSHYGSKIYWPIYEEAERLGCALAIRGGAHVGLGLDMLGTQYPVDALGHQFGCMIQAFALMSFGIFERFPRLRWGFLEGGAGWVPLFLDRVDRKFEDSSLPRDADGEWVAGPRPGQKASDYFKEHIREGRIFVGFDNGEESLTYAVERVGRGPFLFGSGSPLDAGSGQSRRADIDSLVKRDDLTRQDKDALLGANAERFYGSGLGEST